MVAFAARAVVTSGQVRSLGRTSGKNAKSVIKQLTLTSNIVFNILVQNVIMRRITIRSAAKSVSNEEGVAFKCV